MQTTETTTDVVTAARATIFARMIHGLTADGDARAPRHRTELVLGSSTLVSRTDLAVLLRKRRKTSRPREGCRRHVDMDSDPAGSPPGEYLSRPRSRPGARSTPTKSTRESAPMSDPSAARWRVDRKVRPALAQAGWADLPAVHQVLRFIMPDHRLTQRTEATGSTTALLIGVQFFELFGQLFRALRQGRLARALRQGRLAWPNWCGSAAACAAPHFALPEDTHFALPEDSAKDAGAGAGEHHSDHRWAHAP